MSLINQMLRDLDQRHAQSPAQPGVAATLRQISPGFVTALQTSSSQADGNGMVAMPDVDMATEVTSLLGAKQAFAANAQVLRITDEMLRRLYDVLDDHDAHGH